LLGKKKRKKDKKRKEKVTLSKSGLRFQSVESLNASLLSSPAFEPLEEEKIIN